MIDPLISLAFAMQSNKGVYALIIGSGVSRAAQIPTGWEVVLDLATRLAKLHQEDVAGDPAQWYRTKYSKEPDYSEILKELTATPEERQQLLRAYFEPNDQEREDGLKQPTAAHRAIATLVAAGYVRVIITMNFDRLIETAIEAEGIVPTVLSTPDATDGAMPLIHQRCCVIKVHGDYLDTRIKNTPDELAGYDPRIDAILDRVVDEFGIVACGWSAQWDPALCAAFDRAKCRRFGFYWAARGAAGERANQLITHRGGTLVPIIDADTFFQSLAEKVLAIEDLASPHPLSTAAAIAAVKRSIPRPAEQIRLHDLVHAETERAFASLQEKYTDFLKERRDTKTKFNAELPKMIAVVEVLAGMMAAGAQWGTEAHAKTFAMPIERLAYAPTKQSGIVLTKAIRDIPAIYLLYIGGIAALAQGNFPMLASLLTMPKGVDSYGNKKAWLIAAEWERAQEFLKAIEGHEKHFVPLSEWLFEKCREHLRSAIPSAEAYDDLFDRFEVIRSVFYGELETGQHDLTAERHWGPDGRFGWKLARHFSDDGETIVGQVAKDAHLNQQFAAHALFGKKPGGFRASAEKFAVHAIAASGRFR